MQWFCSLAIILSRKILLISKKRNAMKCIRKSYKVWIMRLDLVSLIALWMNSGTSIAKHISILGLCSIYSLTLKKRSKSRLLEFWLRDCKYTSPTHGDCALPSVSSSKTPSTTSWRNPLCCRIWRCLNSYSKQGYNLFCPHGRANV